VASLGSQSFVGLVGVLGHWEVNLVSLALVRGMDCFPVNFLMHWFVSICYALAFISVGIRLYFFLLSGVL
jgi:hypothetical protein